MVTARSGGSPIRGALHPADGSLCSRWQSVGAPFAVLNSRRARLFEWLRLILPRGALRLQACGGLGLRRAMRALRVQLYRQLAMGVQVACCVCCCTHVFSLAQLSVRGLTTSNTDALSKSPGMTYRWSAVLSAVTAVWIGRMG